MCGIAGVLTFDGSSALEMVREMAPVLAHRGPDGEGMWSKDNVAIGHRRLSIIDLEGGKQPLCNEDGTLWITYNGELYNFQELRDQLLQKGHHFRTDSDTEVVVHSYEQWGDACVERFRGMFAFGIVDTVQRRVFLARDQLGIKPLVYYRSGTMFAFASEMQSLRVIAPNPLEIDLQSVDQYLWLQYIPAPRSIYKLVNKLPPGHRMAVTFDGKSRGPEEYWRLVFDPLFGRREEEWVEELDAVLLDSVRAHLVSDVPFGAFLSGGVDSSAVVGYMAQNLSAPVEAFSIGFEEAEYNELDYAAAAAKRWGARHHIEIVKPDGLGILPELVTHYGEPFGDSSAIPTYYVCRMARGHVPMVLSGDGGDEFFGGYGSYAAWLAYLSGEQSPKPLWKKLVYPIAVNLRPERFPPRFPFGPTLQNWLRFGTYVSTPLRKKLWRNEFKSCVSPFLDVFEEEFARAAAFSNANKAQYLDIKTYLPFDILTKVDVASMMNSLEVRTPIIDVRVAEFAARIPESFNISQSGGVWSGKRLLKKCLKKYYPPDFVDRKKMGFAVPIQKWLSAGGESHKEVAGRLLAPNSKISAFFRPSMVSRLVRSGDWQTLWLLLFLDEWLTQNG